MTTSKPNVEAKPFIGVPTTTPIAFMHAGTLYLERMSSLSEEGAGVFCTKLPAVGDTLQVVFRLSTSSTSVRCNARVEGDIPTTPVGLQLRSKVGEKAFSAMVGAAPSDSATMMFRLSDLEAMRKPKEPTVPKAPSTQKATGFSIRFLELDAEGLAAVRKHVSISRRMGESLSTRGERLVELGENDRKTLAGAFDVDNLSKKALDW